MNSITSISEVVSYVRTAGEYALREQQKLEMTERQVKADNSVVTRIDREVEEYLHQKISDAFPTANFIGEESGAMGPGDYPYTFAIDPIDGTDSFSQGMPGWTISIGVLDEQLTPAGGIVYAPAWDALFFADLGQQPTYNGQTLEPPAAPTSIDRRTNLLVDSRIHLLAHLEEYPGKIRSMGSTALHVCGFLTYDNVIGALSRGVSIWDLVGAHAVNASLGQTVEYFDGGEVTYEDLLDGQTISDMIIAGTREGKRLIRETFRKRKSEISDR